MRVLSDDELDEIEGAGVMDFDSIFRDTISRFRFFGQQCPPYIDPAACDRY